MDLKAAHPANRELSVSPAAVDLIARHEGFRPYWYDDPVGVQTIGYGWTRALPRWAKPPLSPRVGRRLLTWGLSDYEKHVRSLVRVPLNQNEYDALVSFVYNLGPGALDGSTLLKRLNAGDRAAAAKEFDRWVFADGKRLPGLVKRRREERELFASVVPGGTEPAVDPEPVAARPPDDLPTRPPSDLPGQRPVYASLRKAIKAAISRLVFAVVRRAA